MEKVIRGWNGTDDDWSCHINYTNYSKRLMNVKLTKQQRKELKQIAAELEAQAIQMKLDYEEHPSDMSGSVVVVHEDSEILNEEEE